MIYGQNAVYPYNGISFLPGGKEGVTHMTTDMDPENLLLNEENQTQKHALYDSINRGCQKQNKTMKNNPKPGCPE